MIAVPQIEEAAAAEAEDDYEGEESELAPFDLYGALGVSRSPKGGVQGGRSRCFSAFHGKSLKLSPERFRGATDDSEDWRRFRRLALAFVVLSDDDRRSIYDGAGYIGLQRSESYAAFSCFSLDPLGVFDDFFEANDSLTGLEDEQLKEYLLLEADSGGRDDVEEEEEDDDDEADDEDVALMEAGRPQARRTIFDAAPPKPPPKALAASSALLEASRPGRGAAYPGANAWAALASKSLRP